MRKHQLTGIRALEGRHVGLALSDGSRIDDCELVSAGRHEVGTLWVFTNGEDTFVPLRDVLDLWEVAPSHAV